MVHPRTLMSVGNAFTKFELGSIINQTIFEDNVLGSSNSLDVQRHDKVVFQWTVTGSGAGSILGGNDNINFSVMDMQNFTKAQTVLVGFEWHAVPRYMKIEVGSNNVGSFTGSFTCVMFAKA